MIAPLISVLIPCHNAERYVASALDSVLAQTWRTFEVIAMNDGSTDRTGEVLERYRGHNVMVAEQENAGASAARNRAFAMSSGQYVLFLDADDLVTPTHLEALHAALPQGSRHVAMSQWDRFREDPTEACFPSRPGYCDLPGPEWLALDWMNGAGMTQPGMFLIPRNLIEQAGGWDERLSLIDDFEFFARIIARCDGVRFAQGARLFYRSSLSGSLSGRKSRTAAESACLSLLLGTQRLLDAEDSPRARRAAANMLQTFIHGFYPKYPDLRSIISRRVTELGGSDLDPPGPPGFQGLRSWLGWKAARRVQLLAERCGLNSEARRRVRGPN